MEKLIIEESSNSPKIVFDIEQNTFYIKGKSVIEEVDEFYEPVITWLENAEHKLDGTLNFQFDLEYFNIASSKRILFILYKLNEYKLKGKDIKVTWNFNIDDEDMKEVGEDFACMVNVPFDFISKEIHLELN